jgi:hypothetical protein
MRVNFRQGIINYQQPTFLSINRASVDLSVDINPLLLTIAAGAKDYLFTERASIPSAWINVYTGRDQWLYIDYDIRTLTRTFGITIKRPFVGPKPPFGLTSDQHWYDTTTKHIKVWNGSSWVTKLRVFVAMLKNGVTPISMSSNLNSFNGTQVGDTSIIYAGAIVYNSVTNLPIKDDFGIFLTTEDTLRTSDPDVSTLKLANNLIEAQAQTNLVAYTIVTFTQFGEITSADGFTATYDKVYGIIQSDTATGHYTNVVINGVITNPLWDWTIAGINAPIYCNSAGQLSTTPYLPVQMQCATVIDKYTILLGTPALVYNGDPTINLPSPNFLAQLSDVSINEVTTGQVLKYNGSEWVNGSIGTAASLPNIISTGTATKITFNSKGLVTHAATLLASDIPNLDWSKITTGKPTTIHEYGITDAYTKVDSDSKYLPIDHIVTLSGDITGSGISNISTIINTLPISKGGTGQVTAQLAIDSLLPAQANHPNAILSTDGTTAKWVTNFTLPISSNLILGGIKIGAGLVVDSTGVVSTNNVVSSGNFVTAGDCKSSEYVLYGQTTTAIPTEILIGGINRMVLVDNSSWSFEILISGRQSAGSVQHGTWRFIGNIHRESGVSTTAITPIIPKTIVSIDNVNWDVVVDADTTTGSLRIIVTGTNSNTIKWAASVRTVEIIG